MIIALSYFLVTISYYDHEVGIGKTEISNHLINDKITEFSGKNSNYIEIEIKFNEKQEEDFLIAFGMDYFYKYNKIVYLYDYTEPMSIVTISNEGIASVIDL